VDEARSASQRKSRKTTRLAEPLPARRVGLGRAQRGPSLARLCSLSLRSRHDLIMVGAGGAYERGGDMIGNIIFEIHQSMTGFDRTELQKQALVFATRRMQTTVVAVTAAVRRRSRLQRRSRSMSELP
jgi:hypothetical protein